jgi:hypothetical protein
MVFGFFWTILYINLQNNYSILLLYIIYICCSSVFYQSVPAITTPCDLRGLIGWLTDNQFVTHSAVDDFYRNKTQCVVTESDGTKKTIDFTAPVVFKFT